MGNKSKKKEKKKKKRRHSSGEESPRNYSDNDYYEQDKKYSKRSKYDSPTRHVPETEEYVYDYSGQEIVQQSSTSRRSQSPESRSGKRDKSPSRSNRKRDRSPPLAPPGTDWPFNASKKSNDNLEDGELDWKAADDSRRDREYQDEVDRKLKDKQKADKRKKSNLSLIHI